MYSKFLTVKMLVPFVKNNNRFLEANVRFTASNIEGQNTLLVTLYVQRQTGIRTSSQEIRQRLTRSIQQQLLRQEFNVTPLIDVSVLEAPNSQ